MHTDIYQRLSAGCLMSLLAAVTGAAREPSAAIDVGSRKQLFIDHRFIESCQGVRLTVNPPVKKEIVLRLKGEEARHMCWISAVLEVDREYFMFYGTRAVRPSRDVPRGKGTLMHVAQSRDGLNWEQTPVNLIDVGRGKENNIVMVGAWGTVFLDPNRTGGYRFWMLGHVLENQWWAGSQGADRRGEKDEKVDRGLYLCRSKDGIHWFCVKEPVFPFTGDTRNQAFFDTRIGKYVAYLRCRAGHGNREVARGESTRLLGQWPFTPDPKLLERPVGQQNWLMTELPIVMAADERDPPRFGIYTPNVHLYPWAQDVYVAFPDTYRCRDGIDSHGRDKRGKPANEGLVSVSLSVSRDGISWHRFRTPYVRLGRIGQVDSGTIYMGVGMILRGDEIWQYTTVSPETHKGYGASLPGSAGGIRRVVQRLDGFVSADTGPEGGELTTTTIVFTGNRLMLNVDCGAAGEVWVELRDADGKPIPGFTMAEAVSVDRNGVAQEVWWEHGPDVGELAGRAIRLHVRMRSAKLFAFQFTDAQRDDS